MSQAIQLKNRISNESNEFELEEVWQDDDMEMEVFTRRPTMTSRENLLRENILRIEEEEHDERSRMEKIFKEAISNVYSNFVHLQDKLNNFIHFLAILVGFRWRWKA